MADAQKALDFLLQAVNETGANDTKYNHIQELRLIDRKGGTDMWGRPLRDGKHVRVVWSDNPNRDDGYYDICVEADSNFTILMEVMNYINKTF